MRIYVRIHITFTAMYEVRSRDSAEDCPYYVQLLESGQTVPGNVNLSLNLHKMLDATRMLFSLAIAPKLCYDVVSQSI
jgi:hypothetical protein